jgi:hypothetical protein
MLAEAMPPAGLMASLSALGDLPGAILVRHSDRHPIPRGRSGAEVLLTKQGEARALELARRLKAPPAWALSSPLARCMDTARLMGVLPEPSSTFGAPGPFVLDPDLGRDLFHGNDTAFVVRGQIGGETWGCMRPLAAGARMIHSLLTERVASRGGLGLAVSHDAIVMPYIAWATGHTFAEDWLEPLDGVVVTGTSVFWRGQRFEVPR